MMATSLLASASNTSAQGQPNTKKVYRAKVYDADNKKMRGILYSVNDSSITLCTSTTFIKDDPLNQSLKFITIPYQVIERIVVSRKGAMVKGFTKGALMGAIPGLLVGAVEPIDRDLASLSNLLGTGYPQSDSGFPPVFIAGITIGGLVGLAVKSPDQVWIDKSLETYTMEKAWLSKYSVVANIYYTSEKMQNVEGEYFD